MKIEHVALYTADLERAKSFYCHYFGLSAGARYGNPKDGFQSYFLCARDGARLEIMTRPGLDATAVNNGEGAGFSHIAFSVGSEEGVDRLTKQLSEAGCKLVSEPRTTGDGYYESCLYDLDGNRIEITV